MNSISKIKLPNSEIYDVKDEEARRMIKNLPSPMIFKGTLGDIEDNPTITQLPSASKDTLGFTYKVITEKNYDGQYAKIGDIFICAEISDSNFTWTYIPSGDESASGTVTSIVAGDGLKTSDGNPITTTGTISLNDESLESLEKANTALQEVPDLDASKITSGTFNDERISSASNWNAKEDTFNKVTSISSESTDEQYPSAKAVYDIIGDINSILDFINGELPSTNNELNEGGE